MILKIFHGGAAIASSAFYLRSGVRSIYKRDEDREKAIEGFNSSFLCASAEGGLVWVLLITDDNGNERYLLAELNDVFVMNDDGKTIDRF